MDTKKIMQVVSIIHLNLAMNLGTSPKDQVAVLAACLTEIAAAFCPDKDKRDAFFDALFETMKSQADTLSDLMDKMEQERKSKGEHQPSTPEQVYSEASAEETIKLQEIDQLERMFRGNNDGKVH